MPLSSNQQLQRATRLPGRAGRDRRDVFRRRSTAPTPHPSLKLRHSRRSSGSLARLASCSRCWRNGARRAPHRLSGMHHLRRQHAAARAQHRSRFDPRFVANPHLAADHGVVLHHHGTGEPGLRRHHHVAADAAVVRTCTMLSSLVPSPITVTPSAARSMQQLAPISTKSPISTRPTCGTCASGRAPHVAESVRANHRAGVNDDAAPYIHVVVNGDVGMEHGASPNTTRLPTTQPAPMLTATPARVPSPTTACGPTYASAPSSTSAPTTAVGWMPGLISAVDRSGSSPARRPCAVPARGSPCGNTGSANRAAPADIPPESFRPAPRLSAAHKRQFRRAGRFNRPRARQFLLAVAFKCGAQPLGQFTNSHGPIMTNPSRAGATC